MNLLSLSNRSLSIEETNGYIKALIDVNDWLKKVTNYDPDKRMVDALDILACIAETGEAINKLSRQFEADLILSKL